MSGTTGWGRRVLPRTDGGPGAGAPIAGRAAFAADTPANRSGWQAFLSMAPGVRNVAAGAMPACIPTSPDYRPPSSRPAASTYPSRRSAMIPAA